MNIINRVCWARWLSAVTSGTDASTVTSTAIDTGEATRALISVELGTVAEGGKLEVTVTESDLAAGSYTQIAAMPAAVCASDTSWVMDVPITKRYIKIAYKRTAAASELDGGILLTYDSRTRPVEQSAGLKKLVM